MNLTKWISPWIYNPCKISRWQMQNFILAKSDEIWFTDCQNDLSLILKECELQVTQWS